MVGLGDGQTVLQPRVIRIVDQADAGHLDAGYRFGEAGAHVWGAARAGLGFTHQPATCAAAWSMRTARARPSWSTRASSGVRGSVR